MEFKQYQHLERFGTTEVEGIELGTCHVFPKLDGTNASIWLDDKWFVRSGSRKRQLSDISDNAGFDCWVQGQENITKYLVENPTHRLFGEWLVPHSLKTYRKDAWRKFYVFDVMDGGEHLGYESYREALEYYEIDFIPPLCTITNGDYEQFINELKKNTYLIEDGEGFGEGIVIKNYDFVNQYGRTTWAKIVTSEFKENHRKEMGASDIKGKKMVEAEIAEKYVTKALCEKVLAKISIEDGFTQRKIPQLLNTVYYDLVNEDCWNFVKEFKSPTINFKTLAHFVFIKVKENLPSIFS